jgi:hypothetical protein
MGILGIPVKLTRIMQMVRGIGSLTFVKYAGESRSGSQISPRLAGSARMQVLRGSGACMGLVSSLEDRMES